MYYTRAVQAFNIASLIQTSYFPWESWVSKDLIQVPRSNWIDLNFSLKWEFHSNEDSTSIYCFFLSCDNMAHNITCRQQIKCTDSTMPKKVPKSTLRRLVVRWDSFFKKKRFKRHFQIPRLQLLNKSSTFSVACGVPQEKHETKSLIHFAGSGIIWQQYFPFWTFYPFFQIHSHVNLSASIFSSNDKEIAMCFRDRFCPPFSLFYWATSGWETESFAFT